VEFLPRLWLKTLLLVVASGCAGDPGTGTASPTQRPLDASNADTPDTAFEAADAGSPADAQTPDPAPASPTE